MGVPRDQLWEQILASAAADHRLHPHCLSRTLSHPAAAQIVADDVL